MRPDERDTGYLLDMLEHARGAAQAVGGRTFEEYANDENLRFAVERRIEIIGEARVRRDRRRDPLAGRDGESARAYGSVGAAGSALTREG